jgi:ubiquinone/menaquinone biosynthesis C-methylase UbiE
VERENWRSLRDPDALQPYLGNPRAVQEYLLYRRFEETPGALDAFYEALFYEVARDAPSHVALTPEQLQMFQLLSRRSNLRLDHVYGTIEPEPGELVLDGGCGPGGGACRLVRRGADVIGIDRNRKHLRVTAALLARRSIRIPLAQADLLHIPFRDGIFRRVVLADVVEHINDKPRLLREVHRILRQDGTVLIHTDSELRVELGVWARRILAILRFRDPRPWKAAWSGVGGGHTGVVTPAKLSRVLRRCSFHAQLRMPRWRSLGSYVAVGQKIPNLAARTG